MAQAISIPLLGSKLLSVCADAYDIHTYIPIYVHFLFSLLSVLSLLTIFFYTCLQSGKESLGEELYRILSVDSQPVGQMLNSLNLKSEHSAIETINRLEAAVFAWKEKVTKQNGGKSPVQKAWSFKTNLILELEKIEVLMDKAEALIQLLRTIYPNLPQTFLEVVKIQYGRVSSVKCHWSGQ